MDQAFELTAGDSIVLKLKRGESFRKAENVRSYLASRGLEVECIGELGDGDLGLFGTIEVQSNLDGKKLLAELREFDEVDAAYAKSAACPP